MSFLRIKSRHILPEVIFDQRGHGVDSINFIIYHLKIFENLINNLIRMD